MEIKLFDVERLKRRIRFLSLFSPEADDLFDKAYSLAMHQVLEIIDDIEHDDLCDDREYIDNGL